MFLIRMKDNCVHTVKFNKHSLSCDRVREYCMQKRLKLYCGRSEKNTE